VLRPLTLSDPYVNWSVHAGFRFWHRGFMAALEAAQQQLEAAVGRLERVLTHLDERLQERESQAVAMRRERDTLEAECRQLRQQLAEATETNRRLSDASEEAERRLEAAVARLDGVSEG
jgi:chromosome segregation ATPase